MNYAKVELHLHFDGSLNLKWAYDKAIARGVIPENTSFEAFYNMMFPNVDENSAENFLKFDLICKILQKREDLYEASYNLVKYLDELGVIYAEIRLASQQHTLEGLSQIEVLQAVVDGANEAMKECSIIVFFINALMHKGDSVQYNYQENLETVEATKQMLGKGVVALDLAGYENNCDFTDYRPFFELANKYHIPYTIHAAEMGIGSHIMDAMAMGASRIGHGINCVQKVEYLNEVVRKQIPLEICLTSNVKPVMNYGNHPIRELVEAGAYITLNSDNMMFDRTCILNEYQQARMLGFSNQQLKQFTINAIKAAFADDSLKKRLLEKIK